MFREVKKTTVGSRDPSTTCLLVIVGLFRVIKRCFFRFALSLRTDLFLLKLNKATRSKKGSLRAFSTGSSKRFLYYAS